MRELTEFKNLHLGKDIYVIASGPSLDYFDTDFFNNKITIGVNQIYKKIKVTYLVRKEGKLIENILKETDDNLIHFISEMDQGGNTISNLKLIKEKFNDKNIVVFKHNPNYGEIPDKLPENGLVVSMSTITSAIHLASYMGAKNIILVGHDCGTLDNKCNSNNYHTNETLKIVWKNGENDYVKWLSKIENQTIKLKQILKKDFNCNVYSLNPFINFNLEGHKYSK